MMMMIVEQSVECELAAETEVLRGNLPHCLLSTTNPTQPDPGSNQCRRRGKPATNYLSYGTALIRTYLVVFMEEWYITQDQ
jgi:hypothetical protein